RGDATDGNGIDPVGVSECGCTKRNPARVVQADAGGVNADESSARAGETSAGDFSECVLTHGQPRRKDHEESSRKQGKQLPPRARDRRSPFAWRLHQGCCQGEGELTSCLTG